MSCLGEGKSIELRKPCTSPVGLIGLGLMGTAIAQRLLSVGWQILGWDISKPRRDAVQMNVGASIALSSDQVFADCEYVLLSLPSHETVQQLLAEFRSHLRAGQIIIDTSTGDPQATRRFARDLQTLSVEYIDATISGSSFQVANDTAVMMIGASTENLNHCENLLEAILTKRIHVGPPGSAAQMKLVTNLVLGLNRAALAEGLAYASQLGLPAAQTLTILRESMAYSRIMDTKGEKMIRGDFSPQAKLSQHAKDVDLMLADANRTGAQLPLTQTHRRILQRAIELGWGELDNSAIMNAFRPATECPATDSATECPATGSATAPSNDKA
jgi:3-hydroxyisobutyrate dehydrogenase-like beta-hydroxyacid dehydrogenase